MEDGWEDSWLGKEKQVNLLVNGVVEALIMGIDEW